MVSVVPKTVPHIRRSSVARRSSCCAPAARRASWPRAWASLSRRSGTGAARSSLTAGLRNSQRPRLHRRGLRRKSVGQLHALMSVVRAGRAPRDGVHGSLWSRAVGAVDTRGDADSSVGGSGGTLESSDGCGTLDPFDACRFDRSVFGRVVPVTGLNAAARSAASRSKRARETTVSRRAF